MNIAWRIFFLKALAIIQLILGRQRATIHYFNRILELCAHDIYALSSRAHLKAQINDREGALQDYANLTVLPHAQASDFFNQGFLLESADELDRAEVSFRKALLLNEQLDRAWFGLGLVLMRQGRLNEAIVALRRNTELQPMNPFAWCELAKIHVKRQEPREAEKIIRHLQGFEPKIAVCLARETGIDVQASLV